MMADPAQQPRLLILAVDAKTLPVRTGAQVGEQAGRILVKMQERFRAAIEHAARFLLHALELTNAGEELHQPAEC